MYIGYRFITAYKLMLFCCFFLRNVETSCHKHSVVSFRHQQTPPLTASDKCHNLPRSDGTVLITTGGRRVDRTRWSQILVGNRDFYTPPAFRASIGVGSGSRRNIAMTFSMKKLEWYGHPMVRNCWSYVYSFRQNVRTWHTDELKDRHRMTA